ncbi:MAG: FecR domain-containing protein, partial [Alphaproteobacteria bacterium]|nr:FecR domain-containing protein [Alphaproteobacteria bacterium]
MPHAVCRIHRALLGASALLAVAAAPSHVDATVLVGNTQTVVRQVSGVTEMQEQTLYVDSEVFQNEDIVTGPHSATRIIFKDGTNLEMGENSRLKLTKLVFDPDPEKSKVAVKAIVGVFRWTSGSLPHSAYEIATPVA